MLMSVAADDPVEERDCLQMVLWVNPDNEVAQRHLDRLDQEETGISPKKRAPR
jgi:hypothetical protein